MSRLRIALVAGPVAAVLAACGGSGTTGSTSSPSPESSPSPTAPPSLAAIDPCALVTSQEASQIAGVTYGPGRPETTQDGGGKLCVYGYQTRNVFTVQVSVAPDAATAQADWTATEADAQSRLQQAVSQAGGPTVNVNLTDISLTGADKAAVGAFSASLSGVTIAGSAIYALKGPIFFTFSDLLVGGAAPSAAAMETQAATVIGRLP